MFLRLSAGLICACVAVGCGDKSLTIRHEKWRVNGSDDAPLASVGVNDGSMFTKTWDKKGNLQFVGGSAPVYSTTEVFNKNSKNAALSVAASGPTSQPSVKVRIEEAIKEKGTFPVLRIEDKDIIASLNSGMADEYLRDQMLLLGQDVRVVTGVALVYGHESSEQRILEVNGQFTLKNVQGQLVLVNNSNETVRLSDGTVFAYRLERPCWAKNSETGKLEVRGLVLDKFGPGETPIRGTSFNPRNAPVAQR